MPARRRAIAATFVANGLAVPSFLARIPERQSSLDLSDAGLGLVLVGIALGALLVSRFAGRAVSARGSRPVALTSAAILAVALWTAGAAPSPPVLFVALLVIGAADAAMDISMNANGAVFESRAGRSVLHGLHAAWSLGALGAAAAAAGAAGAGVPLTLHLLVIGGVILAAVGFARSGLVVDDDDPPPDPTPSPAEALAATVRTRRWRGPLAVLAAATIGGAVIEGAPADWGAVQLERFGVGTGASSLAFAAFMAGMVGGRLAGDALTERFGAARLLRAGMALAAVGIISGVTIAEPVVFAVGLALAGLGASGFFPLAFAAAGRTPGVSGGAGAATVSVAARVGFLAEPLLVGAVADVIGLRTAFALVAVVAVGLAIAAPRIAR